MIQQCFHDLTDVVLRSGAEIYQYVGDEVVLTWPADEPDVARLCLETFFGFDQQIVRNRGFYEDRFAVVPKFRGGAEAGEVTVTEVGDIKCDIAYHGDPLNTAARLLELCKTSSSDLLVSGRIHSATSGLSAFASNPQGEVTLRGKAEAVSVYGMSLA